jgi:hypothetical protein
VCLAVPQNSITRSPTLPHLFVWLFAAQDFNLLAEANSPDGLYTWNVSLAGFSPGSQLAQASLSLAATGPPLRMRWHHFAGSCACCCRGVLCALAWVRDTA